MKWSEAKTCRFVELYRQQECLWNTDSIHYRNKQLKQAAVESIAKDMGLEGFTTADVKLKIKNLRGTYNQELAKIKKSTQSGSGSNECYIPNMKWFSIMDAFVRQIKEKKPTTDNLVSDSAVVIEKNEPEDTFPNDNEEQSVENPEIPSLTMSVARTQHGARTQRNAEVSTVTIFGSRKRRHQELSPAAQELRRLTDSFNKPEDELDAFGRFVALSLKKLTVPSAMGAQSEIQSVLARYRLNEM